MLVDLLAVLRKWRHYQAPGDEHERSGMAELHEVGDDIVASFTRQRKNELTMITMPSDLTPR